MCIAIYKPAGAWAQKAYLRESFRANPHGAGYAFFKDGKITVKKGFFTFEDFWKAYDEDISSAVPALIHFRIATIGAKTEDNCHPFVFDGGVMMHNGPCLNREHCSGDKANDRSDSRQFAEDFLGELCKLGMTAMQFQSDPMKRLIGYFAGYEKIVTMFDTGEVVIYNEKQGHWAEGCWWSNHSYKEYTGFYSRGTGAAAAAGAAAGKQPYTYASHVRGTHGYVDDEYVDWWEAQQAKKAAEDLKKVTGKFVCIWSPELKEYLPEHVKILKVDPDTKESRGFIYEWDEELCGYAEIDRSIDAS